MAFYNTSLDNSTTFGGACLQAQEACTITGEIRPDTVQALLHMIEHCMLVLLNILSCLLSTCYALSKVCSMQANADVAVHVMQLFEMFSLAKSPLIAHRSFFI